MASVPVTRSWRVYINTVEYTYLTIDFTKTHPSPYADTFTILLDGEHNIASWSVVEIRKDGQLMYYGYAEKRKWTSDVDTIISGRCRKVIVWKKWTERFAEARGEMQGFFGITHPYEVFKFIVRCPVSDVPSEEELWRDYPHQKIGWGINPDGWTCSANVSSSGTDPIYAKLRLLDFYWRNRGVDSALVTLLPNGTAGVMQWGEVGGAGAAAVNNCTNDGIYVHENTNGDYTYEYDFADLGGTITGINSIKLFVKLRKVAGWFGWLVKLKIDIYDGTNWHVAAYWAFRHTDWRYAEFDVTHILDTVAKVNAARVRLTKHSGPTIQMRVSCMYLRVDYSANGSQNVGDYFEVNLGEERSRVCAIICQSRHSSDAYPRHYCIQRYEEDSGDLDFNTFTEVDVPANHLVIASATHIDHDQYKDEDTYAYRSFGVGAIGDDVEEFTFSYRTTTDPLVVDPDDAGPIYIPIMISDSLHDAFWHDSNNCKAIWYGAWWRTSAPTGPCHFLTVKNAGASTIDWSANGTFATNTTYYIRLVKIGRDVYVMIYLTQADLDFDENRVDTLYVQVPTADITMQYLYAGVSWNTGTAYNCDGWIENFNDGDWINIVCQNNTCAQDIIHSWTPRAIERIRIFITIADAHAWEISQIYIYECDEEKYRVCTA